MKFKLNLNYDIHLITNQNQCFYEYKTLIDRTLCDSVDKRKTD